MPRTLTMVMMGVVAIWLPPSCAPSFAQAPGHAEHHDEYRHWTMPGSDASCCNDQDCRPVRAEQLVEMLASKLVDLEGVAPLVAEWRARTLLRRLGVPLALQPPSGSPGGQQQQQGEEEEVEQQGEEEEEQEEQQGEEEEQQEAVVEEQGEEQGEEVQQQLQPAAAPTAGWQDVQTYFAPYFEPYFLD